MVKNEVKITYNTEYTLWLKEIKEKISRVQIRAALAANHELIALYWFLGHQIVEKQKTASWGSGFVDQFSKDLKEEFPDIAGFSPKNLRYCRAFYSYYSDPEIWQQAVAKLEKTDPQQKWQQSVVKKEVCKPDDVIPLMTGQIWFSHSNKTL